MLLKRNPGAYVNNICRIVWDLALQSLTTVILLIPLNISICFGNIVVVTEILHRHNSSPELVC